MYIALDIETGGIGLPCSILTGYYAIYDKNLCHIDECSLTIRPDDGVYHLTAEGMAVNKINLLEHNAAAITLKDAGTTLYTWLRKMHNFLNAERFTPVGQGVRQDIEFMIASKLISRGSWEQFVGHQMFDTASVANYLKLIGKIPQEVNGSLVGLMAHFNIDFLPPGPHNAKSDAVAGIDLLKKFKEFS